MWLEAERQSRERWWGEIDRLFAALPQPLFRQVKLLEYDLALRYSSTGQVRDVFSGLDNLPVLSVAAWLLDDLGFQTDAREATERRLSIASLLLAARAQATEAMRDPGGFSTDDRIALVQWLSDRATAELARVVPRESCFWDLCAAISAEEAAQLVGLAEAEGDPGPRDEPDAFLFVPLSASVRLVAAAAMAVADRSDRPEPVLALLDDMAGGFQILASLGSMQRDLQQGRLSHPIAFVAARAGIPLRPRPRPEVILGALVATGSIDAIVEAAAGRLGRAHRAAMNLALPTFVGFLTDAETHLGERRDGLRSAVGSAESSARRGPLLKQAIPALPQAIGMAEGFLLADRTFRESWETHREGMLGVPVVTSRFPAGLVLEILCRQGADVRSEIDEFLAFTLANGFRYYDHSRSGVDADTVGVFLRLLPHATPSAANYHGVEAILECLDRNVQETGAIPVWLTGCGGTESDGMEVIALGEGCATVAAHLLLGLMPLLPTKHHETITTGLRHLLDRIGVVGLAANVNYPPEFALGVFFRLLREIDGRTEWQADAPRVDHARRTLNEELERATKRSPQTTQYAALLALACTDAGRQDLIHPEWIVRVLKGQRFDGSWIGQPFAAAPNRGHSVSWYSSTLLTTALCYDALAGHANRLSSATD